MTKKTRVAVLISGRGSNLASLIQNSQRIDAPYEIAYVITNRLDAPGINHADKAGIPWLLNEHQDRFKFAELLEALLVHETIDLVVLAGFMRILDGDFVNRWSQRIINIHPSLLPDYPGLHPHRRALAAGASYSGCTVHYVIPEVDAGPSIAQAVVEIIDGDTEATLSERILQAELQLYPIVVDHLARRILNAENRVIPATVA